MVLIEKFYGIDNDIFCWTELRLDKNNKMLVKNILCWLY